MDAHHNPYVSCPYNMAHEVPKLRLQQHLLKCRKQHPHSTLKTCPFNATHIIPEKEFPCHLKFCSDKTLIEGQKYNLNCAHGELGNPSFHPDVPKGDWNEEGRDLVMHRNSQRHRNHNESPQQIINKDPPNGALSVLEDSYSINQDLGGFGRGRLQYLASLINKDSP